MAQVEGEDATAVALGAGNHGRVDQAEWKVGIPLDERTDANEVLVAAVECQFACCEIA